MKMSFMVLVVLALDAADAAAPASAQQVSWYWPQSVMYGGAGGLYACSEFLRQP
jgi:hypothetical protein